MKITPIVYFPVKILFVDDDIEILNSFSELVIPNQIQLVSNEEYAVETIKANLLNLEIFEDITSLKIYDNPEKNVEAIISFAYENIDKIRLDENKYQKFGVLVTDYKMGKLTGLDLCRQLEGMNLIKILLTGEYSKEEAIDAFNAGMIDNFLQKGTSNINNLLVNTILKLQQAYFYKISNDLVKLISNKLIFLRDTTYIKLHSDIIHEYQIEEYYLANNYGGYYLKSKNKRYLLNIYTKNDLRNIAELYMDEMSKNERDLMIKAQMIPNLNSLSNKLVLHKANQAGVYFYNIVEID